MTLVNLLNAGYLACCIATSITRWSEILQPAALVLDAAVDVVVVLDVVVFVVAFATDMAWKLTVRL